MVAFPFANQDFSLGIDQDDADADMGAGGRVLRLGMAGSGHGGIIGKECWGRKVVKAEQSRQPHSS